MKMQTTETATETVTGEIETGPAGRGTGTGIGIEETATRIADGIETETEIAIETETETAEEGIDGGIGIEGIEIVAGVGKKIAMIGKVDRRNLGKTKTVKKMEETKMVVLSSVWLIGF
jgi:hypothetical protein